MKKAIRNGSISSYKNLEIYFKEMACKGYMISSVRPGQHIFDEINPKDLDFEVTIFNEYDLLIYGDREKYAKEMKKNGWKYVLKNDNMIVFCRKATGDILCYENNDRQKYEMVKSVWNRNIHKNISKILLGLVIYGMRFYDLEFPVVFISNNFMKIIMLLITVLTFVPLFLKTPYWLFKNRKNISKGNELYHRKKSTDKLLDLYMYFVVPIILIIKMIIITSAMESKVSTIMSLAFALPWIAFVLFYNSNFFCSLKSKFIKFSICFAALAIWFVSMIVLAFYMATIMSGTV
jgi:hypothetical protein